MSAQRTETTIGPSAHSTRHSREFEPGQIMGAALQGGVAAGIANGVWFAIARGLGVPLVGAFFLGSEPVPLTVTMPLLASSVLGLVAGAALVALNAFLRRPIPSFLRLSAGALVLSFAGPVALGDATVGTKIALLIMHLIGGVMIVTMILTRSGRPADGGSVSAEPHRA